ncbi:MAG: ATP-binding cassette domain-containing protein [Candidatus Sericytochromatia bacterium]
MQVDNSLSPSAGGQLAVEVKQLTRSYGTRRAVENLCFDVPVGALCGLVGPNGSGKTTTLRLLLGLIRPDQGSARVLGRSIREPVTYLGRVGALIESPALYPGLSGRDNLRHFAKLGRLPESRVEEVLHFVGLQGRASDRVQGYSLGMKQRLGLALALLPNPELLILDEPTNGLDPAGILEVRALLRSLTARGVTVFVSSHLLGEIEQICDHMVLLKNGKVLFSGPLQDLQSLTQARLLLQPEHTHDLTFLNEVVTQLGYPAEIRGDRLVVTADRWQGARINRAAAAVGIVLNALEIQQRSLEESFFQLVKESHL